MLRAWPGPARRYSSVWRGDRSAIGRRDEASQCGVGGWAPRGLAAWAAADAGFTDEDAAEGAAYRPSAGAAQGRGVQGRLVGVIEAVGGAVRQQAPSGGEVAGRIAREEVAEVDHAADGAVRGEDVGRMQVAVEPKRR